MFKGDTAFAVLMIQSLKINHFMPVTNFINKITYICTVITCSLLCIHIYIQCIYIYIVHLYQNFVTTDTCFI